MKELVIQSLEVSGSPFFKNFRLDFSESLNCIMGGRGTGKTTIVEFIKACVRKNVESDSYSYSLLKNNLGDGSITLRLENSEGVKYKIEKLLDEKPQIYREGVIKDIEEVIGLVNLDIYETNKIEKIGREPIDRLKLIDKKELKKIQDEKNKIYNYHLNP
ncbi:MAG: AAA family ATPase [Balneolaceae bacterium]|nr:AAA family ATPase [Balneolaceae bacterium]